jgi:hypothetical protein
MSVSECSRICVCKINIWNELCEQCRPRRKHPWHRSRWPPCPRLRPLPPPRPLLSLSRWTTGRRTWTTWALRSSSCSPTTWRTCARCASCYYSALEGGGTIFHVICIRIEMKLRVADPDPYPDPDWIRIQSGQWIHPQNLLDLIGKIGYTSSTKSARYRPQDRLDLIHKIS